MYKKIRASEVKPKRTRTAVYKFETTSEWRQMKADLDKGLKPGEALLVVLGPEELAKYNIKSRRSISRFLQKYVKDSNKPYQVKGFERRETGEFNIQVQYTPVIRQRA